MLAKNETYHHETAHVSSIDCAVLHKDKGHRSPKSTRAIKQEISGSHAKLLDGGRKESHWLQQSSGA
jgi:hypothetical protein